VTKIRVRRRRAVGRWTLGCHQERKTAPGDVSTGANLICFEPQSTICCLYVDEFRLWIHTISLDKQANLFLIATASINLSKRNCNKHIILAQ